MDIHEIALRLYIQLAASQPAEPADEQARIELGRQAYRYAEAFGAARDAWIRDQPVAAVDTGY